MIVVKTHSQQILVGDFIEVHSTDLTNLLIVVFDVEFKPSLPHPTYAAGLVLAVMVHILAKLPRFLDVIIIVHGMSWREVFVINPWHFGNQIGSCKFSPVFGKPLVLLLLLGCEVEGIRFIPEEEKKNEIWC